jgi:hypothetical protein
MAMINTEVLDVALEEISTNATVLHICSTQPADYAGIAGVSLGTKTNPTFTGPLDGVVSGRRITVNDVIDGSVGGNGTAGFWALADASRLLAAGALTSPQVVTEDNTFTLTNFDIEIRDPV